MAFSADELRVVRRALAQALHPMSRPAPATDTAQAGADYADGHGAVHEYLRLAEAVDEAMREGGRLRAFLAADLVRYRGALPGSARGYLERLRAALEDGYLPAPDDLAALRSLRALPCSPAERERRSSLLRRCHQRAEADLRARLGGLARQGRFPLAAAREATPPEGEPEGPKAPERPEEPEEEPEGPPAEAEPPRRTPTPAEIWPPRRRRKPPPAPPEQLLAAVGVG